MNETKNTTNSLNDFEIEDSTLVKYNGKDSDVVIPEGVTAIGESAFDGCSSLASITIPDSVTSIGESAFCRCSSLTSITFPESVTSIGASAFSGCHSLTSITIPESVTSIGEYAFYDCESLASITIPDSVTSIGESAFCGCSSLILAVEEDNPAYCVVDNVLFSKDKTHLHTYLEADKNTEYTIPDSVTSIGEGAFSDCESLESIVVPDSVISIGDGAFEWCSSLVSITIPGSVISIGDGAFEWCSSLVSITIPGSVISIGYEAFCGCDSLASITIPDSVTSIGDGAFYGCKSLASITIPDSVTTIGEGMFEGCTSLISLVIPNSVTTIGNGAFKGCKLLTSLAIPDSLEVIGDRAFCGCESLASVTIPDSVTTIGDYAFVGCVSLASLAIANPKTTIGENAFCGCLSLTSMSLPNPATWDGYSGSFDEERIKLAFDPKNQNPTGEDAIKRIYQDTDEQGIAYVPFMFHNGISVRDEYAAKDRLKCTLVWDGDDCQSLIERYKKLYTDFQAIAKMDCDIKDVEQMAEKLKDSELLDTWNTYVKPFDESSLDSEWDDFIDSFLDPEWDDDIDFAYETIKDVEFLKERLASGKMLTDEDKDYLERYKDTTLPDSVRAKYESMLDKRYEICESDAIRRIGPGHEAYTTVLFARRLCLCLQLGAPSFFTNFEACVFATALTLHEYAKDVEYIED